MPRDLIVFGCGSQALYVIDARRMAGLADPVALVDLEGGGMIGKDIAGVPVRFGLEDALAAWQPARDAAIIAHGDNRRKLAVAERLMQRGAQFESVIHPRAGVSALAEIAPGCILCPACEVLPRARIEAHAIVHSTASVDHDCVVGRGCNIAPGAVLAGRVILGEGAYVYTGAVVGPNVCIGDFAVIGAGAVVLADVPAGATMVGNPARLVRQEKI